MRGKMLGSYAARPERDSAEWRGKARKGKAQTRRTMRRVERSAWKAETE